MQPIGKKRRAIAEGYIPLFTGHTDRRLVSHETACLLNASGRAANVETTIFYKDREPVGPYKGRVPAHRIHDLRFNDLRDTEPIRADTDDASVIESDVPIVARHTRLDSRHVELALLSTIVFAADA